MYVRGGTDRSKICRQDQRSDKEDNANRRTYLSAIERSERNISIDNIARIAKGLKVEPWRLLRDD
jgi:hypothetical protein